MFERLPRERERISWIYVILWSLIIFVSIPFVRPVVRFVKNEFGSTLFTYSVVTIICIGAVAAVALLLKRPRTSAGNYAALLAVVAVFIFYTLELKANPEEAVHFIQYGVLALFLYRALTHRIRDHSIYVVAGILGTTVGILDEAIQWLTPERHWDLRDI